MYCDYCSSPKRIHPKLFFAGSGFGRSADFGFGTPVVLLSSQGQLIRHHQTTTKQPASCVAINGNNEEQDHRRVRRKFRHDLLKLLLILSVLRT